MIYFCEAILYYSFLKNSIFIAGTRKEKGIEPSVLDTGSVGVHEGGSLSDLYFNIVRPLHKEILQKRFEKRNKLLRSM